MQHSYDPPGGALHARGRQLQKPEGQTPRRSRSADGTRPQYKDARRNLASPTRTQIEMAAPTAFGLHQMASSEPTYHDVEENRTQQSRQQQQHSRSLSPAGKRRGVKTATPHDPYHRVRQNADPYPQYVEQAYSQRYAKQETANRKQTTESLLMFSDAFDTASAMTGWSEQELIQKTKNKQAKKEKSYSKKKKNRETRILNMPGALKRTNSSSELPAIGERKRYYRGDDGPSGAMTRGVTRKRTVAQRRPEGQQKKQWNIVPTFSRSSEMDSTQGSSDVPDDVSNPAVRRWIQSKQRRKKKEDFPLLSSKSTEGASFPRKDAPGQVARRSSPPLHDFTPNYDGILKDRSSNNRLTGRQTSSSSSPSSRSPVRQSSTSRSPVRQPSNSSSPNRQQSTSRSPDRQPRSSRSPSSRSSGRQASRASSGVSSNAYLSSEDAWIQGGADMNVTPDNDVSYYFSPYGAGEMNYSIDLPDDVSPTSVTSRQPYKKRTHYEGLSDGNSELRSILRNSPRQVRNNGTYPLYRSRDTYDEEDRNVPRKTQTRFSDNVQQRTYYEDEDMYLSESDNDPAFIDDKTDQGVFPIQERNQVTELFGTDAYYGEEQADLLNGQIQERSEVAEPYSRGKEETRKNEEAIRLGAVPRYHPEMTGPDFHSVGYPGSDDCSNISKHPPPEGQGFMDVDGHTLSPIRSAKRSAGKIDPFNVGETMQPVAEPLPPYSNHLHTPVSRHKLSPGQRSNEAFGIEIPHQDLSEKETNPMLPSSPPQNRELWMNDEKFDITDDEFKNHRAELAFIQVVAAVVIQTTFRRYLAVMTFERMVEDHFKAIAGPDIMDPIVPANEQQFHFTNEPETRDHVPVTPSPKTQMQDHFTDSRAMPVNPRGTIVIEREAYDAKPARSDAPRKKQKKHMHLYIQCAIKIQRVFRGWWVRDSLHVDHYCATLIQQAARGFRSRNRFYYDMYCVILVQKHVRMVMAREMAAERLAYIVVIQSHVRSYQARMRVRGTSGNLHLAQYAAAVKMQALCRAFLLQEKYLNILADILIVQSVARRWIANKFVVPYITSEKIGDINGIVSGGLVERIEVGQRGEASVCRSKEESAFPEGEVELHEESVSRSMEEMHHRGAEIEPHDDESESRSMEEILQSGVEVEPYEEKLADNRSEEMDHSEMLRMWKKKKKIGPSSPTRPPRAPGRAAYHRAENAMPDVYPITTAPSDEVSSIDGKRSPTPSELVRPVVISPYDKGSEPRPAKRHLVVVSPADYQDETDAELEDQQKQDRRILSKPREGRSALHWQEQVHLSAKSHHGIKRHPVVAAPHKVSVTHSFSWDEEKKGQDAALDQEGLTPFTEQQAQEASVSSKAYQSAVVAAREALMNPHSFDSPSKAPSPMIASRVSTAARQALTNPLSFDSSTNVSAQTTPSRASMPKRKAVKNSVADFWEQKAANQSKPMFPPTGGLYNSSR